MYDRRSPIPDLSFKIIDSGRLQLLNVLGAGSFGTIYRAHDRTCRSRRPAFLAVKVLPLADRNSRRGIYLWREIRYHRHVSGHPNILKLHRVVRDRRFLYIVLDYCPGGDMFRFVARKHTLARNDALIKRLFLQLIDAVHACHQKGIYHRDLKPENILVSKDLTQIYLGDFGLSTKTDQSRNFGTGSSLYMSPECINANSYHKFYDTRRSDVWALGVILTNMITGRSPWRRATLDDECFRTFVRDPSFLRKMLPISNDADIIMRSIFTLDPAECIELPELRQVIEEIDSFYMSEEEVAVATEHVKTAWKAYQPKDRLAGNIGPWVTEDFDCSMDSDSDSDSDSGSETNSLEDDSDDSDEHSNGIGSRSLLNLEEGPSARDYMAIVSSDDEAIPDVSKPASATGPSAPVAPVGHLDRLQSTVFSSPSEYDTCSSSGDSDSPITPETHARDLADVMVPEISGTEALGSVGFSPIHLAGKKSPSNAGVNVLLRPVDNFVSQRQILA